MYLMPWAWRKTWEDTCRLLPWVTSIGGGVEFEWGIWNAMSKKGNRGNEKSELKEKGKKRKQQKKKKKRSCLQHGSLKVTLPKPIILKACLQTLTCKKRPSFSEIWHYDWYAWQQKLSWTFFFNVPNVIELNHFYSGKQFDKSNKIISIDPEITLPEIWVKILSRFGYNFWFKGVILVLIVIAKHTGKRTV